MTVQYVWVTYGYSDTLGGTGTIGIYTSSELAKEEQKAAIARGFWDSIHIEKWELNLSIEG